MDFGWIFSAKNAGTVGALGFLVSLVGTGLTLLGMYFTYRQAKRARRSADAAQDAVEKFKFRTSRYDAFRDLSQASYALEMARKHLNNDAWSDASESYEDARRAIIRVQLSVQSLCEQEHQSLSRMGSHMSAFCNKVDAALAGKGDYPDRLKVLVTIRKNYEILTGLQKSLQEGAE